MAYNIYNWDTAYSRHNRETIDWLKTVYNTPITEEEFIKQWLALKCHSSRTGTNRPRRMYAWLKRDFGFFTEVVA